MAVTADGTQRSGLLAEAVAIATASPVREGEPAWSLGTVGGGSWLPSVGVYWPLSAGAWAAWAVFR